MMMNPIEALHYANPKVLDSLVGFKVLTFYTKDNNFTVFWENVGDSIVGKTKLLRTEKITLRCLEEISKIHKER